MLEKETDIYSIASQYFQKEKKKSSSFSYSLAYVTETRMNNKNAKYKGTKIYYEFQKAISISLVLS